MIFWTPTDDPTEHPMWETEVNLERGMMRAGADRVKDRVVEAESRARMTRTNPVRGLITEWLPGVAQAIRSWVGDVERAKGGPKPIAYPYVKQLDPYVAALITLRAVLNGVSKQRQKLVGLAMDIGRTCEHEQRVRLWEAREPNLYYHYADEMDRNRATATHRRRVNINRFNALLKDGSTTIAWDPWTEEVIFRVGVALLDCLIRKTQWFEVIEDPAHVWRRRAHSSLPALVVIPKPGLTQWLIEAFDREELNSPEYHPTVMPPRRWAGEGDGRGGYWTPYVRSPRLVRFKASQETQRARAADEYDALDMPVVYDGIHMLQETAWRVNTRVLDVAVSLWAKSGVGGIAGLPQIGETELPPRTPRMQEHWDRVTEWKASGRKGPRPRPDAETDAEVLEWKKKASPIYRFNAKSVSRYKAAKDTILIAQEYSGFERIYFPHMLDFRGRMYPIATYLHPQGNDLARGLLTFADGLPITEENGGAGWLAIHLANVWGNDKVGFDERIAWVEEREALWRHIAADPIANREWTVTEGPSKVDKPFQALAAINEWVGFLDHGWGFVSSLPVVVDGTCNGIQHLSAMLRDPVAGRYVNLMPSDRPQDIYKVVAVGNEEWTQTDEAAQGAVEGLQRVLERIELSGGTEGAKATYWLELTGRDIPRHLTKRQVMVLPYGGTKDSFFTYTREWLDEHDPLPATVEGNGLDLIEQCKAAGVGLVNEDDTPKSLEELARDLRTKRIVFLAGHMWGVVNQVVEKGLAVMRWLQDCAKAVAVANQPIYWEVPSGFVVRHFYGLDRSIKCETMLDGERHQIRRTERTAILSTKEQTQGIAPNFVHSLDASALASCLKLCREAGIEDFVSVHDAYGTHAANMDALSAFLRQAFVETHERDVLGDFRAACQRVLVDYLVAEQGLDPLAAAERADELLPQPLEKGALDIRQVLDSNYFFA